jgi:hypothetical protein
MQPLNHPWAYGRNSQTIYELVEWAGGHPKTLNRWIKERKLEAIQFGLRTWGCSQDAICKFLLKTGNDLAPCPMNGSKQIRNFIMHQMP